MSQRPVLALHGNVGSASDWTEMGLSGLSAVDLWEHSSLSFFEMGHELATSLSAGMEKPLIAGYSLGGRLALHAMAIHPQRWGGAIIASSHPGLECVEDRLARRVSDEIWAGKARELSWEEFLEAWNGQGVLADGDAGARQVELEKRRSEIAMAFETWSLGRQENLRKQLRGFAAPVLWIVGEKDAKFRKIGEEMAEVFSDFTLAVIPGTGHRVLGEKSAAVIQEWIADLPAGNETGRDE